ncbi:MAG: hypothetical protein PHX43_02380 [Alphaproteobacteria bacterium]|nr:hypothetical protein [Alphaproteobacteria bacterium]
MEGAAPRKMQPTPATSAVFSAAGKETLQSTGAVSGISPKLDEVAQIFKATKESSRVGFRFSSGYIAKKAGGYEPYIREAFELLEENKEVLTNYYREKIGYSGDDIIGDYYNPLATMVAGMGLDKGDADGVRKKARHFYTVREITSRNADKNKKDQSVSVLSSVLSDLMLVGAMTTEDVKEKFGSNVAHRTRQISSITQVPITMRPYDKNGRWLKRDYKFNLIQHDLGQDIIHSSDNQAVVWFVKMVSSLQQARVMNKDQEKDPRFFSESVRLETNSKRIMRALHIKGMYLPVAREMGSPFYEEMQDLLVKIIDPCAYRAIKNKLASLGATVGLDGEMRPSNIMGKIKNNINKLLSNYGFKYRIEGRVKSVFSIWQKMMDKQNANKSQVRVTLGSAQNLSVFNKKFNKGVRDAFALRAIIDDPDENSCKVMYDRLAEDVSADKKSGISFIKGRHKNYLGDNKKDTGYKAIHDCMHINGRCVELQVVTENMHDDNSSGITRHAAHKGENNKLDSTITVHKTWSAPSTHDPNEHAEIMDGVLCNMFALLQGQKVVHLPKAYDVVYVCGNDERSGILCRVPNNTKAKDLLKYVKYRDLINDDGSFKDLNKILYVNDVVVNGKSYAEEDTENVTLKNGDSFRIVYAQPPVKYALRSVSAQPGSSAKTSASVACGP